MAAHEAISAEKVWEPPQSAIYVHIAMPDGTTVTLPCMAISATTDVTQEHSRFEMRLQATATDELIDWICGSSEDVA